MKKLTAILCGIALLGAFTVNISAQDADDKKEPFAWHIIIKERDEVGLDAKAYQEALSKAFKSFGDTVEDEATADNITLYIVIGKDDEDDDNDGKPDAEDTDDYGDSFADDAEDDEDDVTVYDMDKDPKFSAILGELPDEDKGDGMYISITSEDGSQNVYVTKADTFNPKAEEKEGAAPALERFFGHAPARKSLFATGDYPCSQSWDYRNCIKNYQAVQEQARKEREEAEKKAKAEAEAKAKAEAEANKSKAWVTLLKSGQTLNPDSKVENPAGRFAFQSDGNIVVYNKQNKPVWSSGSVVEWYDGSAKELKMQADGNLVVFRKDKFGETKECWNSNTKGNDQAILQIEWNLLKLRFVGKDGKVIKNLN
jgi:hypothetical protein